MALAAREDITPFDDSASFTALCFGRQMDLCPRVRSGGRNKGSLKDLRKHIGWSVSVLVESRRTGALVIQILWTISKYLRSACQLLLSDEIFA